MPDAGGSRTGVIPTRARQVPSLARGRSPVSLRGDGPDPVETAAGRPADAPEDHVRRARRPLERAPCQDRPRPVGGVRPRRRLRRPGRRARQDRRRLRAARATPGRADRILQDAFPKQKAQETILIQGPKGTTVSDARVRAAVRDVARSVDAQPGVRSVRSALGARVATSSPRTGGRRSSRSTSPVTRRPPSGRSSRSSAPSTVPRRAIPASSSASSATRAPRARCRRRSATTSAPPRRSRCRSRC